MVANCHRSVFYLDVYQLRYFLPQRNCEHVKKKKEFDCVTHVCSWSDLIDWLTEKLNIYYHSQLQLTRFLRKLTWSTLIFISQRCIKSWRKLVQISLILSFTTRILIIDVSDQVWDKLIGWVSSSPPHLGQLHDSCEDTPWMGTNWG